MALTDMDEFKFIESPDPEVEDNIYEFLADPNLNILCLLLGGGFAVNEVVDGGVKAHGVFENMVQAKLKVIQIYMSKPLSG